MNNSIMSWAEQLPSKSPAEGGQATKISGCAQWKCGLRREQHGDWQIQPVGEQLESGQEKRAASHSILSKTHKR